MTTHVLVVDMPDFYAVTLDDSEEDRNVYPADSAFADTIAKATQVLKEAWWNRKQTGSSPTDPYPVTVWLCLPELEAFSGRPDHVDPFDWAGRAAVKLHVAAQNVLADSTAAEPIRERLEFVFDGDPWRIDRVFGQVALCSCVADGTLEFTEFPFNELVSYQTVDGTRIVLPATLTVRRKVEG